MDQNDSVGAVSEGGGPVITSDHERAPGAAANVVPSFLAELTRAMQSAAEQQREEIAGVVKDDAAAQVDMARKRGAAEAGELRKLADQDVDGIEAWAAEETERIRREAGERTDKRRKELEAHLAKHDSIIESEIEGVGVAVSDYRSTLDDFFDQLREATNPADLARLAGSLPPPPDLETVRGVARADAVAKFANAPEESTEDVADEAVTAEAEPVTDDAEPTADTVEPVVADAEPAAAEVEPAVAEASEAADDSTDDAGGGKAGVGVMDPDAVGRSADLPDEPVEAGVAVSAQRETAAARFLRTIAPWASSDRDSEDHQSPAS